MTVKPGDADELITAADYDKVMEYLQETPRTNKLKILERVTLFSLEIIKLHRKEQDKHSEKEKKPVDAVPTKKRSQRPCKVNEEPSLKKLKFKEYNHLESSNENRYPAAHYQKIVSPDSSPSPLVVEEGKIEDEEWHQESISNKEKRKKKKKTVSRVINPSPRNPNPDEDPHDQYYEESSLKKLKSKEYDHHQESSNEKAVTSDLHENPKNPRNPKPTNGPPESRPIPGFLIEMMDKMKGSEIVLVIEKALTNSDVKRNLSRLQMPESQMNEFLREEEKEYLKIKEGYNMNGIEALLHQRGGELCSKVKLRRWKMPKGNNKGSIVFVLGSGWNDVVARNKLRSGDIIQVWSFRVDKELHFALVLL